MFWVCPGVSCQLDMPWTPGYFFGAGGIAGPLLIARLVVHSPALLALVSKCPWTTHTTPSCSWWSVNRQKLSALSIKVEKRYKCSPIYPNQMSKLPQLTPARFLCHCPRKQNYGVTRLHPIQWLQESQILWTAIWCICTNNSWSLPVTHICNELTLWLCGGKCNSTAPSWGPRSIPAPITLDNFGKEENPAALWEFGSKIDAVHRSTRSE